MFAKNSSRGHRASRPGLMSSASSNDEVKTFLYIFSGCSLVGLLVLVVIRSTLLVRPANSRSVVVIKRSSKGLTGLLYRFFKLRMLH